MNNKTIITSNLLNNYNEIINLFTKKPYNFNSKILNNKEIENNYLILEKEINYNFKKIIKPNQNHTNIVKTVTKENINSDFKNVDGLITNLPEIALVTSLADCQGILLYDPKKKVIGNIHSGWRGTLNKIIDKSIDIMIKEYQCNPQNIMVWITPSIGKCCFEVDEEVKDLFLQEYNNMDSYIHEGEIKNNKQKYFINTLLINKNNLLKKGVLEKNIEISNICTKCNSNIIHSYRKDQNNSGRNIALICIK